MARMATCKLEFMDNENGTVSIMSTPNGETLKRMVRAGEKFTPAEELLLIAFAHVSKSVPELADILKKPEPEWTQW